MIGASSRRWTSPGGPVTILVAGLMLVAGLGPGAAGAQGVTAEAHPAHIHAGTCEQLGDVVAPLTDVAHAEGEAVGPESAVEVKWSETTVEMPLAEIVEGGHAINVHESAEAIDEYIACGDIGGTMVDDRLVIGLQELNGSGHSGIAVLEAGDAGTTVTVYLTEAEEGDGAAASPAADDGDEADATEVTVEIKDFAYNPDPVEVPVGGTITWTNQDSAPHTATARDRDLLQSGTLEQGESYSQTFDESGTFDYFCEFHANMKGTVVVK